MELPEEFTTLVHLLPAVVLVVVLVAHEEKNSVGFTLEPPTAIAKGGLVANVVDGYEIGVRVVTVEHAVQMVNPGTRDGAKLVLGCHAVALAKLGEIVVKVDHGVMF